MKFRTAEKGAALITAIATVLGCANMVGINTTEVQAATNVDKPILEYNFDEAYTEGVAKDSAGNHNAMLTEGATYVQDEEYGQVLYLDGGTEVGGHDSYLEFPEGFFDEMDEMTISMDVNEVTRRGYYFTFGIGQDDEKYLFLKTDPTAMSLAITTGGNPGEDVAKASFVYPNNSREWINVKMVITPSSIHLYQDGKLLAENNDVSTMMSDLGYDLKAYIGKSFYSADKYFRGYFDNVKVYDFAMTADQVKEVTETEAAEREAAISDLNYVADRFEIPNADDIRGNITLPSEKNGVSITWTSSNEEVISTEVMENPGYDATPAGVVTRQEKDTMVKLTAVFAKGEKSVVKHYNVIVKAEPKLEEEEYVGYLFVRFTGTEATAMEEQTYFSISEDGLNWEDLNGGEPVIISTIGESGLRDHYISRTAEGDKFYMIATDLSMYHGDWNWPDARRNGGNGIVVWESEDLVNWSEPWITDFAPDNNGCTWAPEFIYDNTTGEYVVFWSATTIELDENENITQEYENYAIYYAKTRDFRNFTETKIYNPTEEEAASGNRDIVIDSTVIEHDGTYYRYTKNEGNGKIQIDCSDAMLGEFTDIESTTLSTTLPNRYSGVEGPIIFKMNEKTEDGKDQWCLMVDRFVRAEGYYPLITIDLASGEFEMLNTSEFSFPEKYRHGYVLPITATEYNALQAKWGNKDYFSTATLEKAIEDAWALDPFDYTIESYEEVESALENAEDELNYVTSMEDVNALTSELKAAIDQLVPVMDSIEVIAPYKTLYKAGEAFDTTGMVVVAINADGSVSEITEGYELTGYNSTIGGTQAITVTYEGVKATFDVTVEGGSMSVLPYEDVTDSDWFYDAVYYNYLAKTMTGMDETHFGPYGQLSRAQFALILYRIEGQPVVDTDKSFSDISGDEWYGPAVLWAAESGIVTGYESGAFGPTDLITREQMAVMMHRYAYYISQCEAHPFRDAGTVKYLGQDIAVENSFDTFTDAASVSSFATDAVKWAVGNEIITGKDGGTRLDPQGNTARAEAAVIIMRFME